MLNPQEGGRLEAKRHYVILAKALDGIWPVGHACAVLCWGTAAGGGCPSTALHRHGQLAKYHRVLGSRSLVPCYLLLFVANGVATVSYTHLTLPTILLV